MNFRWTVLVLVAAVTVLVAPSAVAQANIIAPEQLPNAHLGYAGFQRNTDAFHEIDPGRVMYPSACAPATADDQYSAPAAHRGREYAVTGFAAMGVTGPKGTVGIDVYAYESPDRAANAFHHLRSLFDRQCPLDHDSIAWELFRESPITGTGSPYAPAQAFTVTAGNEALGSRTSVTFAQRDAYLEAAGYRVDPGSAAPDPGSSAYIADRAARAALEALIERTG
ncbi:hypothetical protein [Nocardia carnea]|uniref:Secreted protein n=1 Tax=Nocardia carnea TaxID=37328 RepID=A0ABW7TE50_9NOCA|nr:hypothetical protein [Nocardia carnea]